MLRVDMIFDSASADLRLVCANRLPSRFVCTRYSQKNIIQMAQIMQNAFRKSPNSHQWHQQPLDEVEKNLWDYPGGSC